MALLIDKECKVAQAGGAELQSTIALDLDRLYGVLQTQADRICPGLPLSEVTSPLKCFCHLDRMVAFRTSGNWATCLGACVPPRWATRKGRAE